MKYNENNKKYSVNSQFFLNWSSDMAYILGFIYADGNLSKDKYRVRISSIDVEILQEISDVIESDRPIVKEQNTLGSWYTMIIDNREIYQTLESIGLTPNKSLNCEVPVVPIEFKFDFIRGYFDGDGCVYAKTHKDSTIPTLSIDIATGSNKFKDGLIELMSDVFDEKHGCSVQVRKNGLNILRMNTTVSERLYCKMYSKPCLHLKRKKEKFDEILKAREKRKKRRSDSHKI